MFPYNPIMNQSSYEQNLKNIIEQANGQLQQIQNQPPQPTNLTQNFQLSPTNNGNMKLINSLEEVQKEIVLNDTYFLANNLNNLWIKNARGEIRTFNLIEIKPRDEKDIIIENLQKEIEKLKGGKENVKSNGKQLHEQSDSIFDEEIGG